MECKSLFNVGKCYNEASVPLVHVVEGTMVTHYFCQDHVQEMREFFDEALKEILLMKSAGISEEIIKDMFHKKAIQKVVEKFAKDIFKKYGA